MKKGYFSKKVVEWYREYHRNLPWRNSQDPYKIWLSEIILQQTRVIQGLPYYKKFILHYPNIKSLARAKEREVLRMWQGLGYYSRARNLHACARKVVKDFKGKFPSTCRELKKLPGIGDYTAAAVASIAFHQQVAVVDGNVFRVLARIFGVSSDITSLEGRRHFRELANQLIPPDNPGQYNQAVMEFGALYCVPHRPPCEQCIFKKCCFAFTHAQQDILPVKNRPQKTTNRYFQYLVFRNGGKILMSERIEKDIWNGLFDFPLYEERTNPEKIFKKLFPAQQAPGLVRNGKQTLETYKHILTHQIIFARFMEIDWPSGKIPSLVSNGKWYSRSQLEKLPKPALITRYLEDRGIL